VKVELGQKKVACTKKKKTKQPVVSPENPAYTARKRASIKNWTDNSEQDFVIAKRGRSESKLYPEKTSTPFTGRERMGKKANWGGNTAK